MAQGSPPSGRRERKKREMRQRIYGTARRLFAERGFADTKVEDITAELDISPATFFNYFGSKDALLREMAEEMADRFLELVDRIEAAADDVHDLLDRYLAPSGPLLDDLPQLNRQLFPEILRVTLPHEMGQRLVTRIQAGLVRLFRAGQARGRVRSDLDAELMAEMGANLLTGVVANWFNDPHHSLSERLKRAAAFLEQSIAARD